MSDFYTYKKWTENEDQILKKAILYYGPKNWQQISYCLEGRNNSQAFHRWMKGINPKIKRSKWSFEEDLTLGIALKIYGNKKWSKIANHLGGRTDIQCRERFCNILDPSLEEVEWKAHEDSKLLYLFEKMKNKWSKIAKEFGNRTDNTCWRRWKYLESVRKSMKGKDTFQYINQNNININASQVTYSNISQTILDNISDAFSMSEALIVNASVLTE
jgi:myb proto-oncogene protein